MAVTLKRLTPDDWQAWKEIRLRALADSPDAFGSTLEREQGYDEADWRDHLDEPTLVAYDGETPVAIGGVYEKEPGVMQVIAMWTAPEFRGQGVGTMLLRELLTIVEAAGATAHIGVYLSNPDAHRLYRKMGFVDVDEVIEWPPGSGRLHQSMELAPTSV